MRFPYHCVTMSPHHHISQSFALSPATKSDSHLPCPLPPNQSFALPPSTKPVSHLPCPLPLCHHTTTSLHHSITTPLHHHATMPQCHCTTVQLHHHATISLSHHISQSFALLSATKSVSHLPCPLPPNQSVIWLALYHHAATPPHHCITAPPHHCTTVPQHEIFPTTLVWIWLVNGTQHSSDWLIVPTTANQIISI